MLNKLELTFFRRHEHLVVNFTDGLQVIRAVNEGGKTTLLESASYALFGTKSLRTSLENAVTWGHKENELKVELEIEVGGQVYLFARSKKGAEVTTNGQVYVTGQNEVSAFAAKLLGADASAAANLMFASQGGLRGALEDGPKATSMLIENLAGFELFDRILDAAQEKLMLGSTSVLEERVKNLNAQLGTLEVPDKPDVDQHLEAVATTQNVIENLSLVLVEEITPTYERIYKAFSEECDRRDAGRRITADLSKVVARISDTNEQRGRLLPVAGQATKEVDSLRIKKAEANEIGHRRAAYEKFKTLPDSNAMVREVFEKLEREQSKIVRESEAAKREAETSRKIAEAKRVSSRTCSFCGMDVSQLPKAAELNAEIEVEIASHVKAAEEAEAKIKAANDILDPLTQFALLDDKTQRAARPILQYLEADESAIPVLYTWKGDIPEPVGDNQPDYDAMIRDADAHNAAVARAKAQIEVLDQQLGDLNVEQKGLERQWADLKLLSEPEYLVLEGDYLTIVARKREFEESVAREQALISQMVKDHEAAVAVYEQAVGKLDALRAQITTAEQDIANTQFNNALLKKIRAARPIVANKLWNLVLTSVSNLFSKMRGEPSVVSKGDGGFLVNGQAVESLSGSTLDLLGLAIRCSLVKTFLPGCPLLVLDEPCAAMDDGRTSALLGFIASAGFSQVILVTHEDTSESIADNLIQL